MIILEPSDNQNERSPLTKGVETTTPSAALATAPPPYAPTVPPNPIPSYQTVPQHSLAHHVIISRRRSPFRRLLVAFAIACLVLLLWGTFLDSLNEVFKRFSSDGFRHGYGYKLGRIQATSHDPDRVLPIQYPPIQPPQMTRSSAPLS